MTNDAIKPASTPRTQQSTRTDDLLAGGADAEDGARGFDGKADPQALQTGMEGIAGATNTQGNRQSESHKQDATTQTLPDNAGHAKNEQKS